MATQKLTVTVLSLIAILNRVSIVSSSIENDENFFRIIKHYVHFSAKGLHPQSRHVFATQESLLVAERKNERTSSRDRLSLQGHKPSFVVIFKF